MRGFNVLHPMGWDAFGLPAENAAIENGVHPAVWTYENIATMRAQLEDAGHLLRLGARGRHLRSRVLPVGAAHLHQDARARPRLPEDASRVNWCPSCQTVLANEQVEAGRCWRCDSEVTKREIEGWFFKITDYAEELLDWCDRLPGWPERVLTMQRNWIGKSEGAEFDLPVAGRPDLKIRIFTTRPDTVVRHDVRGAGARAPAGGPARRRRRGARAGRRASAPRSRRETEIERLAADRPKRGLRLRARAINPFNGEEIPLFLADYVLMGYGTGAIMAVPGEDQRDWDFAKAHGLPIVETVKRPRGLDGRGVHGRRREDQLRASSTASTDRRGQAQGDRLAGRAAGSGKAKVNYRLRDWGISRQRYWGAPIPIVYCPTCGMVPEREENLPVVLPRGRPDHGARAARRSPTCRRSSTRPVRAAAARPGARPTRWTPSWSRRGTSSATARRATTGGMFEPEAAALLDAGRPVHRRHRARRAAPPLRALLHQGAARPRATSRSTSRSSALLTQGMVIKDGAKMSKSKGNVVSPDDLIRAYGADTGRVFALFAAPPEKDLDWNDQGVEGAFRFLNRVWRFVQANRSTLAAAPAPRPADLSAPGRAFRRTIHETIQRVTTTSSDFHFNTAISAVHGARQRAPHVRARSRSTARRPTERASLLREAVEHARPPPGAVRPAPDRGALGAARPPESLFRASWPAPTRRRSSARRCRSSCRSTGACGRAWSSPRGSRRSALRSEALADDKVRPWLASREVARVVVVPDRLVNIVTRGAGSPA